MSLLTVSGPHMSLVRILRRLALRSPCDDPRRHALDMTALGDESDQDPMVARFDRVAQGADRIGGGVVVQYRSSDPALGLVLGDTVELVAELGGHSPSEMLSSRGQDVRGEPAGVL